MGTMVRLLCISLLVGICLAVNGTPQQKAQPALNPSELPRMTEISKLNQQIKAVSAKKDDPVADEPPMDDCAEPPPRRCRHWGAPHDPNDPNSQGWVRANVVAPGQLPDDVKAHLPKWIQARTVPFLPEEPASSGEGGPCCICPQCGLSFYTPGDYWNHIPTCVVPTGPAPCVQTNACLGDSHFDSDPRVCMCRPGKASSSTADLGASGGDTGATAATGATALSSSS